MKKPNKLQGAEHTAERAEHWRISLRTAQSWKKKNVPIDDDLEMVRWFASLPTASQVKCTPAFVRRIAEVRIEIERKGGAAVVTDPDYAEFSKAAGTSPGRDQDALSGLKRLRDFALFKIEKAQARNDFVAIQDGSKQLVHFSAVIHDEEVRGQRLGREMGEVMPRAEVERVIRTWTFHAMRSVDAALGGLCPALVGITNVNDVRNVLEPWLLSNRFAKPFAAAMKIKSESAIPQWFLETMLDSFDDYIERDPAEYAALGLPLPKPPGFK